jgi:hypothetical protein
MFEPRGGASSRRKDGGDVGPGLCTGRDGIDGKAKVR